MLLSWSLQALPHVHPARSTRCCSRIPVGAKRNVKDVDKRASLSVAFAGVDVRITSNAATETTADRLDQWMDQELHVQLQGLEHSTPRAKVKTTQVSVINTKRNSKRLEDVDLEVSWEGVHKKQPGSQYNGTARVSLATCDGCDIVAVKDIKVNDAESHDSKSVNDIIFAVEALDTAIMNVLNEFLWGVEKRSMDEW